MVRDVAELTIARLSARLSPGGRAALAAWVSLAVGALAVAGALALLLALSRTPGAQSWLPWPVESFFRKALVTHVVFSFVIWYLGILGVVTTLAAGASPRLAWTPGAGAWLAVIGALLLLVPTLGNWGEASLNNYVPVLGHPLYYAGLALVAAGVALPCLRLLAARLSGDDPLVVGGRAASLLFLGAVACAGLAWGSRPSGVELAGFNEELFWGAGHLLQFTNTALLLTAWQTLGRMATGASPLPSRWFGRLMALLVLAGLPGPFFYAIWDVTSAELRNAFTWLFWIGMPIPPLLAGIGLGRLLIGERGSWRNPATLGLGLSLLLFAVGGLMGFFLGVGDTRTPSHYHAVIGGVNLAFFAWMLALFLPMLRRGPKRTWALPAQMALYGGGQLLFSVGMFIAGAAGVQRKVAGEAQGLDSLAKLLGMGLTGLGGVVAVIGGVLFVWTALACLLRSPLAGLPKPLYGLDIGTADPHS